MRAGTRARTRGGSATCVMKCNECEPDTRFYCVALFSKTAAPTGPSRRSDPGTVVPQSVYCSPAASGTAIPLPRDAPSSTPGSVLGTFRRRWGCRAASGRVSRLAPRAFSVQTGAVLEPRPYAVRNLRLPREPRVHPLDGAHAAVISKTTTRVEWRKQRESYVRGSDDRLPKIPSKIAKFHLQIVENRLEFQSKNLTCFGSSGSDRAFAGIASRDIECTLSTF